MLYAINGGTEASHKCKVTALLGKDDKIVSSGLGYILFDSEEDWDTLRERFVGIGVVGIANECQRRD